jgi:hypothetical protein
MFSVGTSAPATSAGTHVARDHRITQVAAASTPIQIVG